MMLVVIFLENILKLKAKELPFAYSNDLNLFFIFRLVIHLIQVGS